MRLLEKRKILKEIIAAKSLVMPIFLASLLVGCATPPPPTAPAAPVKISCQLPNLTPLKETKEYQEKGGIEVALLAASYQCVLNKVVKLEPTQPTFGETMAEAMSKPKGAPRSQYFVRTTSPVLKVTPDRLHFTLKLNNKLVRVFRGAGMVVQFNIAGKTQKIDQHDYKDLIEMIVPPRNEQQVEFYGPSIDQIPDQSTIGIFLYDVVTNTDAAGNILEKQNFEWFFKYAKVLHEEEGATVIERVRTN